VNTIEGTKLHCHAISSRYARISTMTSWQDCPAVERDPERVSGAWVFRGTRVPVAALFENLKDGATVEQFLEWFSGVERSQVEAVLDCEVAMATESIG
jgi:uncharacterized protein (DUF433 family)